MKQLHTFDKSGDVITQTSPGVEVTISAIDLSDNSYEVGNPSELKEGDNYDTTT